MQDRLYQAKKIVEPHKENLAPTTCVLLDQMSCPAAAQDKHGPRMRENGDEVLLTGLLRMPNQVMSISFQEPESERVVKFARVPSPKISTKRVAEQ